MNFDHIAFIVFVIIITIFLIFKRKKITVQKLLFPLFYFVLYRTNFGLKWMDRVSSKHRNLVRLFGYVCIGFGFVGLIVISLVIFVSMLKFFIAPKVTETGMALVLPGTTIPGVGYLSFFYFIISILILAIVHEFAHGVVIRAHNIKVKSSGFAFLCLLLPIIPAAFVEPDEKEMAKRKSHVQYSILSAGPISNVLFAFIFLVLLISVFVPIENSITEPIGFTFDTKEGYPASVIESGTLIDSFDGEKVTNYNSFFEKMGVCVGVNETVYLGSGNKTYSLVTVAHPDNQDKGFIGVNRIRNKTEPKQGFETIFKIFMWFKGLFIWLWILNISIGLINLLPIYITDGAKMLLIALQDSIKDKKKALKIWGMINSLFVFLILVGIVTTYLKQFGLF